MLPMTCGILSHVLRNARQYCGGGTILDSSHSPAMSSSRCSTFRVIMNNHTALFSRSFLTLTLTRRGKTEEGIEDVGLLRQ